MNILFFARLFYPHIGGVEKHVLEISKILIKKGHKIIVFTEQYDRKLKLKDSIQGIEVYRVPVGQDDRFKKFRIWWWLWKHRRLIQKTDLVHCHDIFFWHLPFRFLFPKKPVYTTFHGYEGNSLPSKKAIFMHKLAEKLSKGNICVGDYLSKWYGTKPDYVTYGGVDIIKTQSSKLKAQNYNSRLRQGFGGQAKLKAVFVGRLEEETGIMEYLKAVKILKDKGYTIKLDVLGDGSLRRTSEAFCFKNKLNVKFHGFVNNTHEFLSKSNFVFVSRYLGILEAMAAKRLVFALYNNKIKEDYLKMSSFAKHIIISKDGDNLALTFVNFIKDPLVRNKMAESSFEWAKTQSWNKVSQLYVALWRGS